MFHFVFLRGRYLLFLKKPYWSIQWRKNIKLWTHPKTEQHCFPPRETPFFGVRGRGGGKAAKGQKEKKWRRRRRHILNFPVCVCVGEGKRAGLARRLMGHYEIRAFIYLAEAESERGGVGQKNWKWGHLGHKEELCCTHCCSTARGTMGEKEGGGRGISAPFPLSMASTFGGTKKRLIDGYRSRAHIPS